MAVGFYLLALLHASKNSNAIIPVDAVARQTVVIVIKTRLQEYGTGDDRKLSAR